jgi:hypothetical protein
VVREIVRESGGGGAVTYPPLTKTNYTKWAILMRVQLQGAGLWEAVEFDTAPERQERLAFGAILRSVPPEMVPSLAAKDNAKLAWDTIKVMRVGVDRVREARPQKLRKAFDGLTSQSGESIEDVALRVSNLLAKLQSLDDRTTELDDVQKLLRIAPKRYAQMACSIETLLDLRTLSIEELSGHLSASEGHGEPEEDTGGKLLLTEEEWCARQKNREPGEGPSGGGGKYKKKPQGRPVEVGTDNKGDGGGKPPRRNGKGNYWGIDGHWARECCKAKRERGERGKREEANLDQGQEEDRGALLMAMASEDALGARMVITVGAEPEGVQHVLLNEERVIPTPAADGRWFLDT